MAMEQALAQAAKGTGMELLVLFGSRVRGEVHPHSDWDLGYIGEGQSDVEGAPGVFQQFQIEAATFWCDIEPVLRRIYAQILDEVKAV